MKSPRNGSRTVPTALVCATAAILTASLIAGKSSAQETYDLPDPLMTPGAVDPSVTLNTICRYETRKRRIATTRLCDEAFRAYAIPESDRYSYECDHLVPLALGGANVVANLWPQIQAQADIKDRLETELQRRVCEGMMTLEEARKAIVEDWPAVAIKYGP